MSRTTRGRSYSRLAGCRSLVAVTAIALVLLPASVAAAAQAIPNPAEKPRDPAERVGTAKVAGISAASRENFETSTNVGPFKRVVKFVGP